MRNFCGAVFLAGSLIVAGCGKEEQPSSAPPVTATPAAAPAPGSSPAVVKAPPANADGTPGLGQPPPARDGYLGTLVRGQQTAVKGIDTVALNEEVTLFNVQEGRYPKNLQELVTKNYLGKLPDPPPGMKINYDAVAGKVTVVPQ